MARTIASWLSGPGPLESGRESQYPGEALGLPERGTGSLARMGRRLAALAVDWLVAYGLAALGLTFGLVTPALLATAVMVVWFVLGTVAVRLFGFTPGQFMLGLMVVPIETGDGRPHVGLGRAAVRGVMIALVIPALFVDVDGRGLHDRLTGTAVVRR
ncbi:MAG TPA: RDD family protein [Mycobacterium sp.]|nr:RDD family protein [Mycobacterium sp.]